MEFAYGAVVARHVSAEGCQLILKQDQVAKGQRFRFNLDGAGAVVGTVRWVVSDRIGFAFDQPLCRRTQDALANHCRVVHGLELFLA
ncbi:PilZ domain-containing protein [Novosphingobium mangrovi (ex Huang et al. 2023)]|uniref:PilZ domain-containing protein n=1 Tax=Novosphingobium mangrovi (ex Huang et al. 2023) TaxID=2976432 RepID=A0ABT2I7B4_9SPHN|nr:PilZ domain-containing protein [Novosphingobium mangrovi (ex Huang et al. 2023)]MCT2400701.1 PilZ domain-containing protein [Novosphingobium mangrovi (ex Huang et al. 2023)]